MCFAVYVYALLFRAFWTTITERASVIATAVQRV